MDLTGTTCLITGANRGSGRRRSSTPSRATTTSSAPEARPALGKHATRGPRWLLDSAAARGFERSQGS